MNKHKIAIVGSGPAGLAAAIYTSRAEIETTVYAGMEPGGQLTKTSEIENYPGVVGKTGPELMLAMTEQATKFGAKLVYEAVSDLGKLQSQYDAVILAMGAAPRMLGIGEEKYYGKGLSTCAVCDAAFYKGKRVYVVGGGDAAIEDAWALTKFASSVTMLVRGDKFRASIAMQKRVTDNPDKIKVKWQASLRQIIGDRVQTLVLEVKGKEETVPAEGIFLAIGHVPATGWLSSSGINLDSEGYIIVGEGEIPTMTNKTGVFAAGDCVDKRYRQAATAAGMGVAAALDAERWLARNESVV
ncbi:MAG: Thioredoxin reductase [Microgenomates group bacterium GW2011_GWC1_46_16]|uniref:FAD/NAD(P)-binding domain-containing protein n=2 Tax=Candidatus Collieribacteriota TaxID=1752725 RepID=A0A1F5G0J3_9BACT|nr:MAG: Thioredoxin reductase [Microgenomates group bacterium GW2011_GWF1_46_12]KKU26770.1 MAG: Thioredoxin reductase [Microgenomates group bacterium GW2011_GWC1_46_16]KKU28004.1 MAG: Thioredoxin reductase [Microgenomates group bacterium GW2011_GWF2_46_18]KKU44239.1 MAG: Thioredoxin reductase [Microgenomates group bacterium GW2011_GWA1_46_7]KKU61741.1 MAG: Thioredoxin reductase [Microgenomates group bacterium GW2011_GWE1_47_12]OGD70283.1 MAG: hypothetical protein A2187_02420 [Candidatus Collie